MDDQKTKNQNDRQDADEAKSMRFVNGSLDNERVLLMKEAYEDKGLLHSKAVSSQDSI